MYTTFHLSSAEDVNTDLLDAIKAAFKSKAITIIVEEDESGYELSDVNTHPTNQSGNTPSTHAATVSSTAAHRMERRSGFTSGPLSADFKKACSGILK